MSGYKEAGISLTPNEVRPREPRQKPMTVLCLGLSRTGTLSLYAALRQLGFNCYHAWEMGLDNPNGSHPKWCQAIEAKNLNGLSKNPETAEDFDEMLWRYDAVTDIPCVLFADELLKAYPDAKVVLTERAVEGWVDSIEKTFYTVLGFKIWPFLEWADTQMVREYLPILRYTLNLWTENQPYLNGQPNRDALHRSFLKHNKHIKDIVPKERLLVFHPKDGWEPLCKHLGIETPARPFPKTNEGSSVADLHGNVIVYLRLMAVLTSWFKRAVPFAVAGLGWWAWTKNVMDVDKVR